MNILIKGSGAVKVTTPIPDAIISKAWPYMNVEPSPDGGMWLELSPYVEVYDEQAIRGILNSLLPYIDCGKLECSMSFHVPFQISALPDISWSFVLIGGKWYETVHGIGACSTSTCISE